MVDTLIKCVDADCDPAEQELKPNGSKTPSNEATKRGGTAIISPAHLTDR